MFGTLIGRVTAARWAVLADASWVLTMFAAALLLLLLYLPRHRYRISVGMVSAAGLFWGLAHSAPPALHLDRATVVKTSVEHDSSGPVLIEAEGHLYEAYGIQMPGAVGRVRVNTSYRVFAPGFAALTTVYVPPVDEAGVWRSWVRSVRTFVKKRMAGLTHFDQSWLSGFVAGEKSALPADVNDAFKKTGLYHLLVVSGLHVSLMAFLLCAMIRAPLHMCYALRLIRPAQWPHCVAAVQVLAVVAALFYLAVTGSSVAAQRSALLYAACQVSLVFIGTLPLTLRLQWAGVLQTMFFPLGILSESALMSWAAYLLVLVPQEQAGAKGGWQVLLWMQMKLLVLTTAIFGQTPWLGLAVNILVVPLFPLILAGGIAALVAGPGAVQAGSLVVHQAFVELVRGFSYFADRWPWLAPDSGSYPVWVRPLALVAGAWILLNACRDLTISMYDPDT